MHQTRSQLSKKIPLERKGTKYVVRARSHHKDSVPVLLAVRDMIKMAKNAREVKHMINHKLIKLNGKEVKDMRESVRLFGILDLGEQYVLTLNKSGKFAFESFKGKERMCKVIGKKMFKGKKIQFNLHDGTNILSGEKIQIGDTVYLDFSNKIKKHTKPENGSAILVISGKYAGKHGSILSLNGTKIVAKLAEVDKEIGLDSGRFIVK